MSQAQTRAYDEGHDRTFGKHRRAKPGLYVFRDGKMVQVDVLVAEARARDAPVMVGRHHENTCTADGQDIGSRRKRAEYMRRNGLADAADFREYSKKKAKERAVETSGVPTKATRDAVQEYVQRAILQDRKSYERDVAKRAEERRQRGRGFDVASALTPDDVRRR